MTQPTAGPNVSVTSTELEAWSKNPETVPPEGVVRLLNRVCFLELHRAAQAEAIVALYNRLESFEEAAHGAEKAHAQIAARLRSFARELGRWKVYLDKAVLAKEDDHTQ